MCPPPSYPAKAYLEQKHPSYFCIPGIIQLPYIARKTKVIGACPVCICVVHTHTYTYTHHTLFSLEVKGNNKYTSALIRKFLHSAPCPPIGFTVPVGTGKLCGQCQPVSSIQGLLVLLLRTKKEPTLEYCCSKQIQQQPVLIFCKQTNLCKSRSTQICLNINVPALFGICFITLLNLEPPFFPRSRVEAKGTIQVSY